MDEPLKARVHLIVAIEGHQPFSVRTDVLVVTRDPDWAYSQAMQHAQYSLDVCGIRQEYDLQPLSIEWIELRNA